MRIYSAPKERPELRQGATANRPAVLSLAHSYVWELCKMDEATRVKVFWHDLRKLIEKAVKYQSKAADADTDSAAEELNGKAAVAKELTNAILGYLKAYGVIAEEEKYVYRLQNYYHELQNYSSEEEDPAPDYYPAGDAAEDFADIFPDEDEEDPEKRVKWPRALDTGKATGIWQGLTEAGIIDCKQEAFLWYFCKYADTHAPRPDKIKVKGLLKKEFARLCTCLAGEVAAAIRQETGRTKRVKGIWKLYTKIFAPEGIDCKNLASALQDYENSGATPTGDKIDQITARR